MKKNRMIAILGCLLFLLASCAPPLPRDGQLKNDLEKAGYAEEPLLYLEEGRALPIVRVEVQSEKQSKKTYEVVCLVTQQDSRFQKETKAILRYERLEGDWILAEYEKLFLSGSTTEEIADEMAQHYVATHHADVTGNRQDQVKFSNLTHSFDAEAQTDRVQLQCTVTSETCIQVFDFDLLFQFEESWVCKEENKTLVSRTWRFGDLNGTTRQKSRPGE